MKNITDDQTECARDANFGLARISILGHILLFFLLCHSMVAKIKTIQLDELVIMLLFCVHFLCTANSGEMKVTHWCRSSLALLFQSWIPLCHYFESITPVANRSFFTNKSRQFCQNVHLYYMVLSLLHFISVEFADIGNMRRLCMQERDSGINKNPWIIYKICDELPSSVEHRTQNT